MTINQFPQYPPCEPQSPKRSSPGSKSPVRPSFNSQITADRLREGSGLRPSRLSMISNIKKGRKSVFREMDLDEDLSDDGSAATPPPQLAHHKDQQQKDFDDVAGLSPARRQHDERREKEEQAHASEHEDRDAAPEDQHSLAERRRAGSGAANTKPAWLSKLTGAYRRPRVRSSSSAPPATVGSLQRFTMIALLIGIVLPTLSYRNGGHKIEVSGADAGPIRSREVSPTNVCLRWSHQAANVNGTLYMYGGQARMEAEQNTYTWNKNFVTLDLKSSWTTSNPSLTGLTIPDGPPAVANGYLWRDYNNLYLYGGLFADNMGDVNVYAAPEPMSLWRYSIREDTWNEYPEPRTSAGKYAEPGGIPVQRSAEGAGLSVPELGLSWYFGGHLDQSTTEGWSIHTPRVYLKSLLEFTHPGYINEAVTDLASGTGAGEAGVFRNVTLGGLQETNAFPERADGVLVFVPGWGDKGVLIGLAGGTDQNFTYDVEVLDVFDIASSEWYHQKTTGQGPTVRVNLCAAIASAPDASSFQIYFFGGQNLQPFGEQVQYNDMYILSIPAFTWIRVPSSDSAPRPRAGHTCTMRDGQIIVVGGYIGQERICESPGVFVFDASELTWKSSFDAADHPPDISPENSVLAGSFGYRVPAVVQNVIGGSSEGGATATTPAAGPATGGPFATGKPPVFTITQSGATATITQWGPTDAAGAPAGGSGGGMSTGARSGLIAAGVIAAVFGAAAVYLGFCAWLYRRQVAAYKHHLAVANRYSGGSADFGAVAAAAASGRGRKGHHRRDESVGSEESFSWIGALEPKWLSDEPTPGSGSSGGNYLGVSHSGGSGSGSAVLAGGKRKSEDVRSGRTGGKSSGGTDADSISSTEQLLDGQEPSFFSVVMGPRRALRVVNGLD